MAPGHTLDGAQRTYPNACSRCLEVNPAKSKRNTSISVYFEVLVVYLDLAYSTMQLGGSQEDSWLTPTHSIKFTQSDSVFHSFSILRTL